MTEPTTQSGQASTTSEEVDALYGAYAEFPEIRLARVFTPAEIEGYRTAWSQLTLRSQASLGEKIASCPDFEIQAALDAVVGRITQAATSPLEGATVAAVKSYVGNDVQRAQEALAYEQAGANRKTVLDWLAGVIANGTVLVETNDGGNPPAPRVGSVIDTLGNAVTEDDTNQTP